MILFIFVVRFLNVFAQSPYGMPSPIGRVPHPPGREPPSDPTRYLGGMFQRGPPPDSYNDPAMRTYPGQNMFAKDPTAKSNYMNQQYDDYNEKVPHPPGREPPIDPMAKSNYMSQQNFYDDYKEKAHAYFEMYDEISETAAKITQNNKWDELKQLVEPMKSQMNDPVQNKKNEQIVRDWASKLPALRNPKALRDSIYLKKKSPEALPSPGMSMYWSESEKTKYQPNKIPNNMMMAAIKNLAEAQKQEPPSRIKDSVRTLNKPQNVSKIMNPLDSAPKRDDFGVPIRWVLLNSNETREGLSRVTDPLTGQNREIFVNGSTYVPVENFKIAMSVLTTTPKTTPINDTNVLRTVARNLDLHRLSESDWLAFEVALSGQGIKRVPDECESDGCQARCTTLACESSCNGDTCASGCVGRSCIAFCHGPGCLAMCIGESCVAKCEGMACEARCRGADCDSHCRSLSCRYITNDDLKFGGGTWVDHYPEYGHDNIHSSLQ